MASSSIIPTGLEYSKHYLISLCTSMVAGNGTTTTTTTMNSKAGRKKDIFMNSIKKIENSRNKKISI